MAYVYNKNDARVVLPVVESRPETVRNKLSQLFKKKLGVWREEVKGEGVDDLVVCAEMENEWVAVTSEDDDLIEQLEWDEVVAAEVTAHLVVAKGDLSKQMYVFFLNMCVRV